MSSHSKIEFFDQHGELGLCTYLGISKDTCSNWNVRLNKKKMNIIIDYPLNNPIKFSVQNKSGIKISQIIKRIDKYLIDNENKMFGHGYSDLCICYLTWDSRFRTYVVGIDS